MENVLHYGDNLHYLRGMYSEAVDLVYLDPPFNSKSTYNLLFHTPEGDAVQAQTAAFKDTWWWDTPAAEAFEDVLASGSSAAGILRALQMFLGQSDMMAYLSMMAVRLIELQRILKPTGSLYLHCDPTASHYLKILLDGIFGPAQFRNEIVWLRSRNPKGSQHKSRRYGSSTDSILYYGKSADTGLFLDEIREPLTEKEMEGKYKRRDAKGAFMDGPILRSASMGNRPNLVYEYNGFTPGPAGWRVIKKELEEIDRRGDLAWSRSGAPRRKWRPEEDRGWPVGSLWDDIPPVNSQARERLGYPTQKPIQLLERIIRASSVEGDIVLDPFCGCGTTVEAAAALGRDWVGIDITHHAINIIEERLRKNRPDTSYEVKGRPEDLSAAEDLAGRNPYEFQWWANWLLGVQNYLEYKKGADRGIDGIIYFRNGPWGIGEIIVSVKSGRNIGPDMIASLAGTVQREEAELGVFVCLAEPTQRMKQDSAAAGFERTAQGRFQKIQIATIADLLEGKRPQLPAPIETDAFRRPLRPTRAQKAGEPDAQLSLRLPIAGGKHRADVKEHLSGRVLAHLTGN